MKKINFKPDVALKLGLGALGVASWLLSSVNEKKQMESLKSDLKEEILKDLSKPNK